MKTADATSSFYLHPRSRWFEAVPRDRFLAELRMTHEALGAEFGPGHPVTLIAGSWAAVAHCHSFERWPIGALTAAEPVLRLNAAGNAYALACNLAAQGFEHLMFNDPSRAPTLFEEALHHAKNCSEIHAMDVLKIVEVLAEYRNDGGHRRQAVDLLSSYEKQIARNFASFPNECYDLLGLWVEYVGDAQVEARGSIADIHESAERTESEQALTKAVVALTQSFRKAFSRSDIKAAHRHIECAVTTLMASQKLRAHRGAALASMLATQAASRHPKQEFYVRYA